MARFFIDRPVFAWVIALFIIVIGLVSYTQVPIAQYPSVAPPKISISAIYPGASAQTMDETVLSVIERELNGSPGLAYIESTSQSNGRGDIQVSFEPGTDVDLAQVDVQNRLSQVNSRLPAVVKQQGIKVEKSQSNFLMFASFFSERENFTKEDVADYVERNVLPVVQRTKGVGKAQLFASPRAMRIWIDPDKLTGYDLTVDDVSRAIAEQNLQVAAGTLGDRPSPSDQTISATIVVDGQMKNSKEFGEIVLVANPDGSTVRLKDVARIELGSEYYMFEGRLNGKSSATIGVQLSSVGNAVETAQLVKQHIQELEPYFPDGMKWAIPYDSSTFVTISLEKVLHTLVEAIVLVFIVMFVFLQNWRYTIIPTIVVPIALFGTLIVVYALGYSLNVLSMFGMVLVIGIVVDDAIIVVENVERHMSESGMSPKDASKKAMSEISGAIVGVTLVLIAVFVPLGFFSGSIGNIYRQFAVTMVSSIVFSAFLALSLTPALCASFLKPVVKGEHQERKGFFGWFNRMFKRTEASYERGMSGVVHRVWLMMGVYLAITAVAVLIWMRIPSAFLPQEDQGYIVSSIQLPPGASFNRTLAAVETAEDYFRKQPEVKNIVSILGFSFSGQGQNTALQFVTLKDWSEREGKEHAADAIAARGIAALSQFRDAFIFSLSPPPIPELGSSSGFALRLQDRGGLGYDALIQARNQLLALARDSKVLAKMRPDGMEDAPQLRLNIDRDKANALGVSFSEINATLGMAVGSYYVNDFPNGDRLQRVTVQADATTRMKPEDILKLRVKNRYGETVPLSAFTTSSWEKGAMQVVRYNGYVSMKISGDAAPGYSTGEAMAEMERLITTQLPKGIGYEWTGLSREEKLAGSAGVLLYAFSILAIFLCLAALYESWSIPLAVILVVPLGMLGVVTAVTVHGISQDVYFQIGLVTIIGLSAKNAILIIEFAKDIQEQGAKTLDAALQAAHLRFRPILMTSLAFTFGVLPLYLSTGASSASQHTIGTGVIGGMITGTIFSLTFVPTFFVFVRYLFRYRPPENKEHTDGPHDDPKLEKGVSHV